MVDCPYAKFGDSGLSRFGFILQTDTDRQTESQMRMIAMLTQLPSASVIKIKLKACN